MARTSALTALLAAEEDPSTACYKKAVDDVIHDLQQISCLMDDEVMIHLATNYVRLARFFRSLRSTLPSVRALRVDEVAVRMTDLLTKLIPELYQLLELQQLVVSLTPALEICLAPSQPRGLRRLAKVISGCGGLLEYLASDPCGSVVIRQWVYLPTFQALDVESKAVWTQKLSSMVSSCTGNHEIAHAVQQWGDLKVLQTTLRDLEQRLLTREAKQNTRMPSNKPNLLALEEGSRSLLESFGLKEPESRRMVQNHIETLAEDATTAILRSIAASFPCKRCIPGLGSTPQDANEAILESTTAAGSDLELDVLGKGIGIWKILLSAPALKSIQTFSQAGLFDPLRAKLNDLASGYLRSSLAGSSGQREQLMVPLRTTKCAQNSSILWQISIGNAGDEQTPQQVILVWEVGDPHKNSKAFYRVIHIQKNYTNETISRSCQRNSIIDGRQIPLCFKDDVASPSRPPTDFDVRTVDQETIAMASRFYALTEPVIRALFANDLAAEFPFDLSGDEARCVQHFQTASLVLGRSGTGKTTCLIFKMVGSFLASRANLDERPARQVGLS